MKKLLLVFSVAFFGAASVNAQSCTPGANYADSTYGVWPDTTTNFPPGAVGVPYSTDLNFKVPSTVTAEVAGSDPVAQAVIGSAIQDFTVTGVTGLPATINYACNISSCTYAGGSNGCANLYGTPDAAGTFPITIDVEATVLVELIPGFPTPLTVPTSFSGYKLVVGYAGQIEITINGLAEVLNVNAIKITNMAGQVVKRVNPNGTSVNVNVSDLDNGIYFVVVNYENGSDMVKFIKE